MSNALRQAILRSLYVELTKKKERTSETLAFCCILFTLAKFALKKELVYSATIDNEINNLLGNRFITDVYVRNLAMKRLGDLDILTQEYIHNIDANGCRCRGRHTVYSLNPRFVQLSQVVAELTWEYLKQNAVSKETLAKLTKEVDFLKQGGFLTNTEHKKLLATSNSLLNSLELNVSLILCYVIHSIKKGMATTKEIQEFFTNAGYTEANTLTCRINQNILTKLIDSGILLRQVKSGAFYVYEISEQQEHLAKLLSRIWEEYSKNEGFISKELLATLYAYL